MAVLELKSTSEFVRSSDDGLLGIYELELDAPNSYGVKKENWSLAATVVPKKTTLAVKGASIRGQMLEKLQKDLHHWHLSVNCEGLCYLGRAGADTFFNVEYCRLNDLFSWCNYVEDPDNQDYKFKEAVKTVWNRCDMRDGEVLLNYEVKENTLEELEKNAKEKEEELDKKEKELEKVKEESKATRQVLISSEAVFKMVKEELEIKCKEINELKDQHSSDKTELKSIKEELQKKEKELNEAQNRLSATHAEKVKELEKVKKESKATCQLLFSSEAELKVMKEELEIKDKAIKDFKDQLSSNKTQLKSIKEELQKKEKELNEVQNRLSSTQAEKVKELENVKEEAKKLGKKYSITETELNVKKRELELKDKELQELKDKPACSEELEKKDKELKKAKDQLSFAQAKLMSTMDEVEKKGKELESLWETVREQEEELRRNGLSSTTGSTCVYIFQDIVLRRRLPLAPEKFYNFTGNLNTEAFRFPPKGETPRIYTPLDSDKHKIGVNINRARYTSDEQWDKRNWWLITVSENETYPFTIAFYGGNFDSTEAYGTPIGIPFHKGATFKNDSRDQVSFVRGIGMRFLIAFAS